MRDLERLILYILYNPLAVNGITMQKLNLIAYETIKIKRMSDPEYLPDIDFDIDEKLGIIKSKDIDYLIKEAPEFIIFQGIHKIDSWNVNQKIYKTYVSLQPELNYVRCVQADFVTRKIADRVFDFAKDFDDDVCFKMFFIKERNVEWLYD